MFNQAEKPQSAILNQSTVLRLATLAPVHQMVCAAARAHRSKRLKACVSGNNEFLNTPRHQIEVPVVVQKL
jgi:hypothetical protein